MAVQWAATKLMTAKPKRTAPRMAKIGATPNGEARDCRSVRMAVAPASFTQPAACQRARSRSALWRYQDMSRPLLFSVPQRPPGELLIDVQMSRANEQAHCAALVPCGTAN